MHAYMHACMHTYRRAYIGSYIRTCIRTYMHACTPCSTRQWWTLHAFANTDSLIEIDKCFDYQCVQISSFTYVGGTEQNL